MRPSRQAPARPAVSTGPFADFTGPGRRRTDHPAVVGTLVVCVGIIALASVLQIFAVLSMGSQLQFLLDYQKQDRQETASMRSTIIRNAETQATIIRRTCLNVARTENDRADCLVTAPPITPKGGSDH